MGVRVDENIFHAMKNLKNRGREKRIYWVFPLLSLGAILKPTYKPRNSRFYLRVFGFA